MRDDISSLMDGEFEGNKSTGLIERMARDEEARDAWATYHLIGDTLRGDGVLRPGMQEKIFAKLTEEPTILAPKPLVARIPTRRLKIGMAIAASVATLSVVAWMAGQDSTQSAPNERIAAVTVSAPTLIAQDTGEPSAPTVMQANLNEYLLAHEEYSPYTGGFRFATASTVAPLAGAPGR